MPEINRIKCGNGNCFIVKDGSNAILVDTSRTAYRDKILEECRKENVSLIFLTHGHVDHVQNVAYLAEQLKVPVAMHREDYKLTKNNMLEQLSAKKLLGKLILKLSIDSFEHDIIEPFEPDIFFKEGDTLEQFGINARVIELPGHTKGSIGLVAGEDIIVGDALMNMFYPTVSMLYGNEENMLKSAEKITSSGAKMIYFGHGKSTANRK
jgi:glyoxylase-like metal-dependent hydrolase (beta-lactamase superfamily II)